MAFEIKSYDFDRDDGLVEVVIKLKRLNSLKTTRKTNENLCVKKVRAPKIDIQILRNILKSPLTIDSVREFYRIYGYKMIQMEFGQFEMFNIVKRQQFQPPKGGIRRWGLQFQLGLNSFEQIFDSLKEILYSQRVAFCCQNDNRRKFEYPFRSLMVFDPIDTLEFSLYRLSDIANTSGILHNELMKMKMEQFQKITGSNIAEESLRIIIPFLYVQKVDRNLNSYLMIANLSRSSKDSEFELKIESATKFRAELDYRNLIHEFVSSIFNVRKPITPMNYVAKHIPKDQIQNFINALEQTAYGFQSNQNYQKYMEIIPNHIKSQRQQNQILDPQMVFPTEHFMQIQSKI